VRSSVRAGAQVLVVQTNNATFGHTSETYQQLAMSRLRAIEHGRYVLQVATSGKSAVIGPDGDVQQESGALYTPAILQAEVTAHTAQTPATRLGALPEWILTGLALACGASAAGTALAARRRSRHPADRVRRGRRGTGGGSGAARYDAGSAGELPDQPLSAQEHGHRVSAVTDGRDP